MAVFDRARMNPENFNPPATEHIHPTNYPWRHLTFFRSFDWPSIRRGRQVYTEVFAPCHSLHIVRFRHFEQFMTKKEVEALAANYEVADTDDQGNAITRPAGRLDLVPQPYPNDKAAAFANQGAVPPDLSAIAFARHGGLDYIFGLLTSYHRPIPAGFDLPEGKFFNPYFPGGIISMPPPLSDGMLEYEDGTPATVSQMAKDVCNFLFWVTFPTWDQKTLLGTKYCFSLAFLIATMGYYSTYLGGTLHRARQLVFRPLKRTHKPTTR